MSVSIFCSDGGHPFVPMHVYLFYLEEWFVCHPEQKGRPCWQFLWIFHTADFWLCS